MKRPGGRIRTRRHDDAHRPLGGTGERTRRPKGLAMGACPHRWIQNVGPNAGRCLRCGEPVARASYDLDTELAQLFAAERPRWHAAAREHGLHPQLDALIAHVAEACLRDEADPSS